MVVVVVVEKKWRVNEREREREEKKEREERERAGCVRPPPTMPPFTHRSVLAASPVIGVM